MGRLFDFTPAVRKQTAVHGGFRDADGREKIKDAVIIFVELYKAVMSCLLLVFIPQNCPGDPLSGITEEQFVHACSYYETVQGLYSHGSKFNKFVSVWNFICLFVVVGHYWAVWKREKFLVEYLQTDDNLPDNNLKAVLAKHMSIDEWFTFHNRVVFLSSSISILILLSNFVLSGIVIFRDFYAGFRTVSVYISYFLLISTLVWKGWDASYDGIYSRVAYSSVQSEPQEYNAIDLAHIHDDDIQGGTDRTTSLPVQPEVQVSQQQTFTQPAQLPLQQLQPQPELQLQPQPQVMFSDQPVVLVDPNQQYSFQPQQQQQQSYYGQPNY